MSCRSHEADLALYVEGDLPDRRVPTVERHLATCAACRVLLAELRSSQAALADLRSEPVDEISLAAVRQRVMTGRSTDRTPTIHRRWTLAAVPALAAVAVIAVGGALIWHSARSPALPETQPASASRGTLAPGRSTTTSPRVEPPLTSSSAGPLSAAQAILASSTALPTDDRAGGRRQGSTLPARTAVSRHMARSPEIALSADDADQLARAVQVISAVDRVPDASTETPPASVSEPTSFVRLATADPTVVIYLQLEPTGGI